MQNINLQNNLKFLEIELHFNHTSSIAHSITHYTHKTPIKPSPILKYCEKSLKCINNLF
jgi:hypothetical protein